MCEYVREQAQRLFSSESADYRFLTYRDNKSSIGKVSDHCRKVSKTFIIVRECNKRLAGYHYHAIMRMDKEPTRSWYKKGVHIHLTKIGKSDNTVGMVLPGPEPTKLEIAEHLHYLPEDKQQIQEDLIEHLQAKTMRRLRAQTHLNRVINYLVKEMKADACNYTDYIVMSGNVSCAPCQ